MGQLVVVSNRVAIPEKNANARAGGLEVAVRAALTQKSGIWFGWSGKIAKHSKIAAKKVAHDKITYITIDLSKEDHHEYYNGFANRVLWPILHYRVDVAEFSRRDLSGYLRVNDHFARHLNELLEPDDLVWVHDYHLMPLARALRERGHRNRRPQSPLRDDGVVHLRENLARLGIRANVRVHGIGAARQGLAADARFGIGVEAERDRNACVIT